MANAWITTVKEHQSKHGGTYKQAMIACGSGKTVKVPKKVGKKGKKQKGGFIPLAVAGTALATGAISGTAGFGINKLLGSIF